MSTPKVHEFRLPNGTSQAADLGGMGQTMATSSLAVQFFSGDFAPWKLLEAKLDYRVVWLRFLRDHVLQTIRKTIQMSLSCV